MQIRQNNIVNFMAWHWWAKDLIISLWRNNNYLNTKLQKSYEYKFLKYMA